MTIAAEAPSTTRTLSMREAINEALRLEMQRDATVILMGEDVAGGATVPGFEQDDAWGGVLGVTKGLVQEFGRQRVLDTPISESAYIGAAVGAAATGLRAQAGRDALPSANISSVCARAGEGRRCQTWARTSPLASSSSMRFLTSLVVSSLIFLTSASVFPAGSGMSQSRVSFDVIGQMSPHPIVMTRSASSAIASVSFFGTFFVMSKPCSNIASATLR